MSKYKCPKCEMEVDAKKAKENGLTLKRMGEISYFCSKDCLEKFKKNPINLPEKCAKCMKKCSLEETTWKIKHKGILYCFCSEKCKKEFQKKQFGHVVY